jgi:hypothetical protein
VSARAIDGEQQQQRRRWRQQQLLLLLLQLNSNRIEDALGSRETRAAPCR